MTGGPALLPILGPPGRGRRPSSKIWRVRARAELAIEIVLPAKACPQKQRRHETYSPVFAGRRVPWMCRSSGPAGSHPPRFEFGSGRVGRERTISREESAATSAGHSPCLHEVNVPDGRRRPLPSPDTVVCQKRVARHLAFCPTPAPAIIR
jgi:hypothetical protein